MTETTDTAKATASIELKKYALRLALAMLVFSVLGFLALPLLAKWVLVDQLSKALQRPVAVESVRINPYTLSVQVAGFAIQEKGGGETVAGFRQSAGGRRVEFAMAWRAGDQ
jgi:hypothetical protein